MDTFNAMKTSTASDKPEIQIRITSLFGTADKFNQVVAALACRELTMSKSSTEGECCPDSPEPV